MKKILLTMITLVGVALGALAQIMPLYENDLEKAEVGKVPEDFLVLDGAFAVKAEGGNRFLELPGAPLDTYGVLFGPTESAGVAVSARIHGTAKGRRSPTFGVGLNGVGGYKLQVSPAKKALELYKSDELLGAAPFLWESDAWTMLRLQIRKVKDGEWRVEGKVWKQGAPEPKGWSISHEVKAEPNAGRASIWGSPYAGTPIRFDDLRVTTVAQKIAESAVPARFRRSVRLVAFESGFLPHRASRNPSNS
jgi:hypothetical protein